MEQLKNNRWVVLLVGVILIFICAATVWVSNGVRPSYAEAASVGMGACELTDIAFDEVLHPEFIARPTAWVQKESRTANVSADKKIQSSDSATDKKAVSSNQTQKSQSQKSKTNKQTEVSSNVSDQPKTKTTQSKSKSDKKTAATPSVSAQKSASAVQADVKKDKPAQTGKAVQTAAKEAGSSQTPPNQIFFTTTALLSQDQASQATWTYALADEEVLLLQRIVMAEAEGEPYAGKVAVANVVLNRLRSANYPDTIRDVIYQRYQFSPVQNGRFDRVVPSGDSVKAVAEALNGRKEVPDDTYYFVSLELATDMTVPNTRTPVKKIGHHTFFK
ncbi:cell wall hydrolase [Saccharibacillus qingshengii]|uniref:cell wall hydrolase n=1 Tax=Saccharibacillus qingshengii TaxID=1763540 RepID=UPI001FE51B04|nr:cell wall hydrolase [Saccharibacillus qingshengii]